MTDDQGKRDTLHFDITSVLDNRQLDSQYLVTCGRKCVVPTDLSSILVIPVHGAANLSEHCGEEGAPCQNAVWSLTQQPCLNLLWPHTHPCRIKVWRVLCQPLSYQLDQGVRWDWVCCCVSGWRHSETKCAWGKCCSNWHERSNWGQIMLSITLKVLSCLILIYRFHASKTS